MKGETGLTANGGQGPAIIFIDNVKARFLTSLPVKVFNVWLAAKEEFKED